MRCFSSPGSPRTPMDSAHDDLAAGFPHSEIRGSKPAHGSPRLIAACHVLHRLSTPRHPPDALTCSRSASSTPAHAVRGRPRRTWRRSRDALLGEDRRARGRGPSQSGNMPDARTRTACPTNASSQCQNTLPPAPCGGAGRDRTDDLLLAKQALSRLSYGPEGPDDGGPG